MSVFRTGTGKGEVRLWVLVAVLLAVVAVGVFLGL